MVIVIEGNYFDYEEDNNINNGPNLKKIVFIGLSLIIGIILFLAISSIRKGDSTSSGGVEERMIEKAKDYVKQYSITSDSEIFLDVRTLNFEVPENCNQTSGVIFKDDNYKAFLSCDDYETPIIEKNKSIKLNGKTVMVLSYGMNFKDPGYSSYEKVNVSGSVGTEPGVYNLYYIGKESNEVATRKVIVVNNPSIINLYPSLALRGKELEIVNKDTSFVDMGAVAYDKTDGEITRRVTVENLPNTRVPGEYIVSYSAKNTLGYIGTVTRKVIVVEQSASIDAIIGLSDETLTNKSVDIVVNIVGDNYQYTLLPNGGMDTRRNFTYSVSENGNYIFKIVDLNNNTVQKEINVQNILNGKPTGSCIAVLHNDKTTISVSPDSRIISYRYHIGNDNGVYSLSDSYTFGAVSNLSSVRVDIRNAVGVDNTITCNVVNLKYANPSIEPIIVTPSPRETDPSIGNSKIKYLTYHDIEYVIANTKNDPQTMVRMTRDPNTGIGQQVDQENCGTECLSFAKYYATFLQYKELSNMNQYDACNYNKLAKFKTLAHVSKQDAIKTVYNEINNGRVVVLQVTGNKERTRRHFVTVVGYRRSQYYPENIAEQDLLCIDAWTGNFVLLDANNSKKRTMFYNRDGYRVDVFA